MGLFSSMTTGLYRYTSDGRRLYRVGFLGGLSQRWYLISDEEAPRLERRLKRYFGLSSFVLIPLSVVFLMGDDGSFGYAWWLIPIVVMANMTGMIWILRGVPRVYPSSGELLPVDLRKREIEQAQAMGEPAFWVLLFAALAMAANAAYVLTTGFDWIGALGVLMFGAGAIYMVRGIVLIRKARHAPR